MSVARKCDRCGKYYELSRKKETNGIITMERFISGSYQQNEAYDLCKECREQVLRWLKRDCDLK